MTAGLPIEGVDLIALDSIPDIFKTSVNVTAHMTATVLLARSEPAPVSASGIATPPIQPSIEMAASRRQE